MRIIWTDKEIARLRELRAAGRSYGDIGRELGRSAATCNSKWQRLQEPVVDNPRWYGCPEELQSWYTYLRLQIGAPAARKEIEKEMSKQAHVKLYTDKYGSGDVGKIVPVEQLGWVRIDVVESDGVLATQLARQHFPPTHLGVLIDESGSMLGDASRTISSYNEYIQTLKAQGHRYRVSLSTFSSPKGVKEHYVDRPITEIEPLTARQYTPDGGTPLYDAVATLIHRLALRAQADPVLVVIITDGAENASVEYPTAQPDKIRAVIRRYQDDKRWGFVFLGADITKQDVGLYAAAMGLNLHNTVSYGKLATQQMYQSLGTATANFAGSCGATANNIFGMGAAGGGSTVQGGGGQGEALTLEEVEKEQK